MICTNVIELYYDYEENRFFNESAFILLDIYKYISPNDLYLFKKSLEKPVDDCECVLSVRMATDRNTRVELYILDDFLFEDRDCLIC